MRLLLHRRSTTEDYFLVRESLRVIRTPVETTSALRHRLTTTDAHLRENYPKEILTTLSRDTGVTGSA